MIVLVFSFRLLCYFEISAGLLAPWVVFSMVWSVGSTCDNDGRVVFDKWIRRVMIANRHQPLLPLTGLAYDYRYEILLRININNAYLIKLTNLI